MTNYYFRCCDQYIHGLAVVPLYWVQFIIRPQIHVNIMTVDTLVPTLSHGREYLITTRPSSYVLCILDLFSESVYSSWIVHLFSFLHEYVINWVDRTLFVDQDAWCHMTLLHYCDVIMGAVASQITSLAIVYSTVYSDADQRKHQSSASLAFVGQVNSPHKWPVTWKMFPFDDVIMYTATN